MSTTIDAIVERLSRLKSVRTDLQLVLEEAAAISAAERMTRQAQREMERKAKRRGERMGDKIWVEVTSQPTKHKNGRYIGRATFHWQKDREKKKHSVNINTGGPARIQLRGKKLFVKPRDGEGYFYGVEDDKAGDEKERGQGDEQAKLAPPYKDPDNDGIHNVSRVGVPADIVPTPPAIPRLPGLTDEEKKIEEKFIKAFEENPDAVADQYIKMAGNKFVADDAKLLCPDYTPKGTDPGAKVFDTVMSRVGAGEKYDDVVASLSDDDKKIYEDTRRAIGDQRAKVNVVLHQVANAIAKRAFVKQLDELAKLPEGDPRRSVLVTSGGCGAGKGFALKNVQKTKEISQRVGAVWDAAGEQNSTENPWILQECKKRGLKATFAFVDADPKVTWADPSRGVVQRASQYPPKGEGRMVPARLFADSYALGARNFKAFQDKVRDDGAAEFIIINSRGSTIEMVDNISKEALDADADELHTWALKQLEEKAPTPAIAEGGKIGNRIWKNSGNQAQASVMATLARRGVSASSDLKKEYDKFFLATLKSYGADSLNDLDVVEKKKFFDEIERGWKEGVGRASTANVSAAEADSEASTQKKKDAPSLAQEMIDNITSNLKDQDAFYKDQWENQLKALSHSLVENDDGGLSLPKRPATGDESLDEEAKKPADGKSITEGEKDTAMDTPVKPKKAERPGEKTTARRLQARADAAVERLAKVKLPIATRLAVEEAAASVSAAASKQAVSVWMKKNFRDFIDDVNEVNATELAEAAAEQFDLYEDKRDYTIPEWVFDEAARISIMYETGKLKASTVSAVLSKDGNVTPRVFLFILSGLLTRYDQQLSRRPGRDNMYRLGHFLGAVDRIEKDMKRDLDSKDPEALEDLKDYIRHVFSVKALPPAKKVIDMIDLYLKTGAEPLYSGRMSKRRVSSASQRRR